VSTPQISLRNFDSRIPLIRAELRGDQPMGSTYASPEAFIVAMAEEIRDLHALVRDLQDLIRGLHS
jgi:hypothetical protein